MEARAAVAVLRIRSSLLYRLRAVASGASEEHVMSPLSAAVRVGGAAALLTLSGCYYPYPYGYYGYAAVPTDATQREVPAAPNGTTAQPAPPPRPPHPAQPVAPYPVPAPPPPYVAPAYYPGYYPAYPGWYGWPGWWGPPVTLRYGYCCGSPRYGHH
jgi:hypothetical protein